MKNMARTRNSIHNIIFAFLLQAVSILTNFVIRTIMVRYLGIQAVSLNGLFTEVLSALSLAELGVGAAIVYNLYKPLAENDHKKVSQLMVLFKNAYRLIAMITFFIGIALSPWIHYLINSISFSLDYIRLIYILFVIDLSISYLFSYKASLMIADQKNHIHSKISMGVKLFGGISKIIILMVSKNFVAFLVTSILITLVGNIVLSYVVDRIYPWLKDKQEQLPGEERKEVFSNIKNLFIKTLSGKITNSTDNILISTLVSTIQVGFYSNYSLVIGIFRQISNQIAYGGISASLGNLLMTEKDEKCIRVFYRLTYFFNVIASVSCVSVFCCITPFISMWFGSDYLLSTEIVFICCLNLYIEIATRPLWSIMEVSGLFKYDKYISIAGSIVNLVVSIVLGLYIGMLGIFIGTFMTYFIQAVLKAKLLFRGRFQSTPVRYYLKMLVMSVGMLLQLLLGKFICSRVIIENSIVEFIVYGCISVAVVGISIVSCTFRADSFQYFYQLLRGFITRRRSLPLQ